MGKIFCVVPFEIPQKLSYPYIERCRFYPQVKIWKLLDLKAHKCFWNAPLIFKWRHQDCGPPSQWYVVDAVYYPVNSSSPGATYMRQWTGPSLIQLMACRLFGAKPLPEPMLAYCQLDSWEQISVKFESEFYRFHSRKSTWKCCLPKWWPFVQGEMSLRKPVECTHSTKAS